MHDPKQEKHPPLWANYFRVLFFVSIFLFLLILIALPFVLGFGVLFFQGEQAVVFLIKIAATGLVGLSVSGVGYLIVNLLHGRRQRGQSDGACDEKDEQKQ